MVTMLEHGSLGAPKGKETLSVIPIQSTASNNKVFVTVTFLRGKKKKPLIFSYCPFCGVLFSKLVPGNSK